LGNFRQSEHRRISKGTDRKMQQPGSEGSPSISEKFLTLREAAEVLRLSTRTVREYLKRGEIRGKLIGKRWRFKRADLDAFFENAPSQWDFVGKNGDGD
jgi:excisionase family DNA binding protein